jgi:predicted MPP superfamily phosphohydrolase
MTSSQTAPIRTNGHHPDGALAHTSRHPLAGLAATPISSRVDNPFDSSRLRLARSWFGLGMGAAALGWLGLRRYGRPVAAGAGALGLASMAYMVLVEPGRPMLERVTLRLPALPAELDGLRVGQISDCHLGMPHSARNLAWAVEQMRRERPELIALTGDFVSRRHAIPTIAPLLRGLDAPLGVYAIPGNHDYWEGLADIHAALALDGIPLLINEHRRLRWNGADLWLAALDDLWDGRPDLDVALDGVPRGACTLLLSHAPDSADEAARRGVAAQLSGHTHGGHMRLPLLGPFALPRFGWRYAMGGYRVGAMELYVSRGLSGGPFRLLCPPEATIFTLRRS